MGHGVGHRRRRVKFDDLRLYPEWFELRHYLFPSVPHDAISKYLKREAEDWVSPQKDKRVPGGGPEV